MKYFSTKGKTAPVTFKEAVFQGLPADNGLFMPEYIPRLPDSFFDALPGLSLPEIGLEVISRFAGDEISRDELAEILNDALSFRIPLRNIGERLYALELFHGPTLAFKDVGARFLARVMSQFISAEKNKELTVLVATSGDTGSAVANGFYNVPGIRVVILYPAGKISYFQEQQITTLGGNITALEINGTFDDCQHLVKTAFLDEDVARIKNLTSANSINIARLLPQSLYYFYAWAQLPPEDRNNVIFSVPSGNYGNLTAGLLAAEMGLPVKRFIASSNVNNTIPEYLETGKYRARASIATISNAMDVGNPSNFARMYALYSGSRNAMTADISGYSFTDEETRHAIRQLWQDTGYTADPHGAVALLGLQKYRKNTDNTTGIFLETAHPVKFSDTVEELIGQGKIEQPAHLNLSGKDKKSIALDAGYEHLKSFLMDF